MSVDQTLKQRGNRYGDFHNNAYTTQELMRAAETGTEYYTLSDTHREALHMIFHKIARMVNGDCWYDDTPHDIAGYAKLLEDYIKEQNAAEVEERMEERGILPDEEITGRNRYLK